MYADLDHTVPQISDTDVEEALLGTLLISPGQLPRVLSEVKLTPESFYLSRNRAVYRTILKLYDTGSLPELELVQSNLNGDCPSQYAYQLANTKPIVDVVAFAKRIADLERWRRRREGFLLMGNAIQKRDMEAYARARAFCEDDAVDELSHFTPDRLANEFLDYLDSTSKPTWKLPFDRLNERIGGGLRPKQFTVLGGWTGHGKSALLDQLLEDFSNQGASCHLYMNEMGHEERVARICSRRTGIPVTKILAQNLNLHERDEVKSAVKSLPFSITPCAGWTIEELAFDIRNKEYDVIAVDIIHQFDYDSESELARISRYLTRLAMTRNIHIIGAVHLNEGRAKDAILPRPVPRDIRGSGMLQRDPANIMFVHREQDPNTNDPTSSGAVYFSKVRNGAPCWAPVRFRESRMSFEQVEISAYA